MQKPLNCRVMGETSGDTNTQKTCADMTATFLPFPWHRPRPAGHEQLPRFIQR